PLLTQTGILASSAVRDVTERRRVERALKDADRRKDEFLAMLAHELRNPLAPILNGLEVLHMIGPQDPALEATREIVEHQARYLVRLVDDLLDLSRISRGKIELKKEPVEIGTIVNRAAEAVRPLIDERKHRFSLLVSPEPMELEADPVRL